MVEAIYIDGTNKVLGRLASFIAKTALNGEKIILLNCEKVVITGNKYMVINNYSERMGDIKGRHKGPFWAKRPDNFVRRVIKKMLPFNRERGKKAIKRVEVYMGIPKEYAGKELYKFKGAGLSATNRYISVGQLSERLTSSGWK